MGRVRPGGFLKKRTIGQKLKDWDGKEKLTAKEFAVMKSMETKETKQVLAALREQREKVFKAPVTAVIFVRKIGGQ